MLRPGHAAEFEQNLKAFEQALDEHMFGVELVGQVGGDELWALLLNGQLDTHLEKEQVGAAVGGWLAKLRPHRGAPVIVYHRSWVYFVDRFGLRIAAELEPKPGIPPTASHLQKVIRTVSEKDVPLIMIEPFYNRKAADKVAAKTDAEVIVCANSVGGQAEASDYIALLDLIVSRVADALER